MKSSTAMALAIPLADGDDANPTLYSSVARVLAWDTEGAMLMMMSKIFRTLMVMVTNTTTRTGASMGMVTRRNVCHSVAPSMRAASSTSRLMAARPAPMMTMATRGMLSSAWAVWLRPLVGVIDWVPLSQ